MSDYCKGIYAGCCIVPNARCAPCERIRLGKSTVEKEMARKRRGEVAAARLTMPCPYKQGDPGCNCEAAIRSAKLR